MGNVEKTTSATPFWYRRISEITWLLTALLVGSWAVGAFWPGSVIATMHIDVPMVSVIGALIASSLMLIAYIRRTHRSSLLLTEMGYILMFLTALYTVIATGDMNPPFIALWLMVSIFPAIFGLNIFIPVTIATNLYIAYLYFFEIVSLNDLPVFIIAFELPLIVSFLIWRKGAQHTTPLQAEKDPTFKALAKELSQVSNQSDIVINAIADGVVAVDGQGIVQLINPAAQQIIGWFKQDALRLDYRSVLQLFNHKNESVSETQDPVQQCLHTNEKIETDGLQLATTSGKKIMVSLLVSPIGQIGSGVIIVFRDITAQRAEERQQAEFISTASHEMRTPVAAIEGYIGLALNPQTATIDEKAKLYLAKAHESAQHLGRLFQDLLDISKAEDGRLDNNPRVIDLVAYVRDITLSFNHLAVTKGLVLLYKPDTSSSADQKLTPAFFVQADADHLREVTANLIENAIKYTKSGDVTVNVLGDDAHVEIAVTDTGIGIPQEDISHLFQKFYRVDNSDTREIGGTGLGLYLCRRLVETMGGRIWVTSEYGRGSTFHIEMPRMSNIDAIRAIEAAANEPEKVELHAKASFLASEEEAAAIQQAASIPATLTTPQAPATPATPVAVDAAAIPATPAQSSASTPVAPSTPTVSVPARLTTPTIPPRRNSPATSDPQSSQVAL